LARLKSLEVLQSLIEIDQRLEASSRRPLLLEFGALIVVGRRLLGQCGCVVACGVILLYACPRPYWITVRHLFPLRAVKMLTL
jgi:hypothetical protein